MATKSILKSVNLKTPTEIEGFVTAMEQAEHKKAKTVVISRTCKEASVEDIRRLFGKSAQ